MNEDTNQGLSASSPTVDQANDTAAIKKLKPHVVDQKEDGANYGYGPDATEDQNATANWTNFMNDTKEDANVTSPYYAGSFTSPDFNED